MTIKIELKVFQEFVSEKLELSITVGSKTVNSMRTPLKMEPNKLVIKLKFPTNSQNN